MPIKSTEEYMGFGNSLATGYESLIQLHVRDWLLAQPNVQTEFTAALEALDPCRFGSRLVDEGGEGKEAVGRAFLDARRDPNNHWAPSQIQSVFFLFLCNEASKNSFLAYDKFKLMATKELYISLGAIVLQSPWWEKNKKEIRKMRREMTAIKDVHNS
jgi:hypothetical protein